MKAYMLQFLSEEIQQWCAYRAYWTKKEAEQAAKRELHDKQVRIVPCMR